MMARIYVETRLYQGLLLVLINYLKQDVVLLSIGIFIAFCSLSTLYRAKVSPQPIYLSKLSSPVYLQTCLSFTQLTLHSKVLIVFSC